MRTSSATLVILTALLGLAAPSAAHEGTPVSCARLKAVDGDTIKCDGINMRDMGDGAPFVSGYDTPEISKPKCAAEKALGERAKTRMAELLKTPGVTIFDSGVTDRRYSRPLVWVMMLDSRSVGSILIAEGLARTWTPEYRGAWCQ